MRKYRIISLCTAAVIGAQLIISASAADGTVLCNDNFESGMSSAFADSTATNKVVDTDGGKAYAVSAPAVMNRTNRLRNFELAFDAKIGFDTNDVAAPAVEFRKIDDENTYRLSFNTPGELLTIERVRAGISTPLGSLVFDVDKYSGQWKRIVLTAEDDKITVRYGDDENAVLEVVDAFPIGMGLIEFKPGSGSFEVDNINLVRLPGGIETAEQGEAAVGQQDNQAKEVEGDIIYQNNFDSGNKGTLRSDNKSEVVENEDGFAYKVLGYDYEELSFGWTDFSMECDVKIDFQPYGATWPAVHMRRASNGYRYDIYFESGSQTICIERNTSGQKTFLGNGGADFVSKNGEWAHIKVTAVGSRIRFYYEDMSTPVFDVTDPEPIAMGGIGFANGGSPEFLVDNIVVKQITVIEPEVEENYDDTVYTDYDNSPYKDDINLLMGLGILPEYDEETGFSPDDLITRAEYAKMLYNLIGEFPENTADPAFVDVDMSVDGYNEINILAKYGYFAGGGNGMFFPDNPVTVVDAAKMILSAMGYDALIEKQGGYPSGYYNAARSYGLLKDLDVYSEEELSRDMAAKMVSNALEIPFYTLSVSGTEYSRDDEMTFLTRRDIIKEKGLVTANFIGGIHGYSTYAADEVEFGDRIIKSGKTDISEQLGRYIVAYIYQDELEDEEIVLYYAIDKNKKESIKVSADDVDETTTLTKFVYRDGEKLKNITLKKNITILENGAPAEYNAESLKPDNGWVTLISTDNSTYDLILVENYETFVVGNYSVYDSIMYDKFDSSNTLKLDDTETLVYRAGEEAVLNDIQAGDVLSYAYTTKKDGQDYCIIYATNRKVSGVLTESYEENGHKYFRVEENIYAASRFYDIIKNKGLIEEPTINSTATFFMDRFGKVAYTRISANGFGLIYRTYFSVDSGDYCMQVFTQDGEWKDYRFSSNWKLNGETVDYSAMDTVISQFSTNQLVYINTRKGDEIYSIRTEQPPENKNAELVFNKSLDNVEYFASTGSFNNQSFVDGNTIVFVIPHEQGEKEKYYVRGSGYLSDGTMYYAKAYNQNKYEVAEIVVVDESKREYTNPGKLDRPFVFDHLSYSITSDGDKIALLHGYTGGEEVTYRTEEIDLFLGNGDETKRINKGDSMRLVFDDEGMVAKYVDGYWNTSMSIFRVNQGRQYMFNTSLYTATDMTCVRADVVDYDAGEKRILLSGGAGTTAKAYYMPSEGTVYVYDKATDELRLGSRSDIAPGDFIIMEYSWNVMRDLLIYKNLD